MSNGATTWTYTYDANGMRTSRTNGTVTYNYIYNGGQLVQMTKGTDVLYFDHATGTVTWNGVTYYYVYNLQGDVIAILDSAGTAVVNYVYDAWGNLVDTSGYTTHPLGTLNPLTYRAYTYDHETGLYYLQSRYYNPEVGRFLNADNYPSTGQGLLGNNMFAYCGNNPVSRKDDGGEFWNVIVGAAIGAVVNTVVSYAASKMAGEEFSLADAAVAFAGGAITGAVAATGLGAFGQALVGAAVGFGGSVMNNVLEGETISWGTAAINGIAGFAGGLIGGNGIRKAGGKLDIAQKALDYATSLKDSGAKMVRNTVTKAFQTAAATYAEVYATESLITLGRFYAGAWGAAIISKGSTQLLALEMG